MERANLRELMESEIPKVDSFLPISQFDVLYRSLNPKSREPWYLGDAVCALIFREEGKLTRIYRGNPLTWGNVARRLALGELGIDAIATSPLGSGVLTEQMVAELEAAEFEAAEFEAKKVTLASVSQWAQPESPPVNNRPRSDVQRRFSITLL